MSNDRFVLDAAFAEHRKQYLDIFDLGSAFEIFTADLVLKRRRLSIDELRNGVVGGGKDGGLDTIFIFVNGRLIQESAELPDSSANIRIEVFFIQAKHSIDIEQVILQKLRTALILFLNLEPNQKTLDTHFNSDLQSRAALYRAIIQKYMMSEYSVRYNIVYCCRSANEPNDAFMDMSEELVKACSDQLGPAQANFMFFGAQKLYQTSVQPAHTTKELTVPLEGKISNDGNFIALVRLEEFLKFISIDGGLDENMFEFNVRDFEGNTKPVNKAIAETIQEPTPESDFWWYNNGVTVIASEITQSQKNLIIHDPMIVNGLQTANVIYSNKSAIEGKTEDDRRVLVKVISIDDQSTRDGVIKATNSQTNLNALSLKATDAFQRQIQEYLSTNGYYYERRKNYYKNRNMPSQKILDISRLGQAVMSLNIHVPHEARGRPGTYLNNADNYQKVFPTGQALGRFLVAAVLERKLEKWLRTNRANYDALYRNNLRFHTLMVLSWNLMGKRSRITKSINTEKATDAEIKKAFDWVKSEYSNAGGDDDQMSKSSSFTKILSDSWTP